MRRWIHTTTTLDGDPSRLEERLQSDLPAMLREVGAAAEGGRPAVDGSFLIELPSEVAGVDLAKQVRVRTDVVRRSGSRLVVPLEWQAEPAGRVFPAFTGQIELEPLSDRHVQLSLVGSYRVPLGPMGAVADAAVLHRAAQRTAEKVLDGVARQLGASRTPDQPTEPVRRWPLRVRDIMTQRPLTLDPDMPVKTAALMLFHAEVSGAPVVATDGELIGVVSERDLLSKVAPLRFRLGKAASDRLRRREARTVGELCTRPAAVAIPEARLSQAAEELLDRDIARLVVVDAGRVVGIVSRHDVLAALVRDDADLHATVVALLETIGVAQLEATVTWGEVTLSGVVDRRSLAEDVVRAVSSVEGVIGVEASGIGWHDDDAAPLVPMV